MTQRLSILRHLLALATCVVALSSAAPAQAQLNNPKIAADLARTIGNPNTKGLTWAKSQNGQLYAKVLIVASGTDPELVSLTQDVLAQGGSVHYVYLSVRAMAAMVPVARLNTWLRAATCWPSRPTAWPAVLPA